MVCCLPFSIYMLAHECRNIPLEPIPTGMMCELQGDATREDTMLQAAVAGLYYPGRVSFGENPQDEEVAPSTTLPTKIATPESNTVVGSNRCRPRLSPNAAILIPAHRPKAATSTANTEEHQPPAVVSRGATARVSPMRAGPPHLLLLGISRHGHHQPLETMGMDPVRPPDPAMPAATNSSKTILNSGRRRCWN